MKYIFFVILFLISCDNEQIGIYKDNFYNYSAHDGIALLPLIFPYHLLSIEPEDEDLWSLNNQYIDTNYRLPNSMDSVGIWKSVILVKANRPGNDTYDEPYWILIVVDKKEEKLFYTKRELMEYLSANNIEPIKLYNISDVYRVFNDTQLFPPDWPKHELKKQFKK